MAVTYVEIKDSPVFKDKFATDLHIGVNVFIGGNGTGKTTLMKAMYKKIRTIEFHRTLPPTPGKIIFNDDKNELISDSVTTSIDNTENLHVVYIPEKDILEHAKGLLTFIEQKQTGFDDIYKGVIIAAQDVPTQKQSETQKSVGQKIAAVIGGDVRWDKGDGSFYTLKTDGSRVLFANEASGYKKFGFLGLLVLSGQLESGSVLFWDEPENSLNPELVPVLVGILLELSKSGVQVFIATHDYGLARYFDARKDKSIPVMFHNMSKGDDGKVICYSSDEYINVPENLLETASTELFKAVVADAMGVHDDE